MKLSLAILLASSLGLAAETAEHLDKKLDAKPGGQLVVEVDFGTVEISTQDQDKVSIEIDRKVSRTSKSDEKDFLDDRPIEITNEPGLVTIRSKPKSRLITSWGGIGNRQEAKYMIVLPSRFNAELQTSGGSIRVDGLQGTIKARTSGGSLKFSHIKGDLNGSTSGGGINASDCDGKIKIRTSGGGITVDEGSGTLDGSTSGGSVRVKNFAGPTRVSTSGGSISMENIMGEVDGSTSGGSIKARFTKKLDGAVRLATSGGSVTVELPADSAFDLDAATSGGGVHSELPVLITGKPHKSSIRGPVNGGGRPVRLRTSGGSINVNKS